MKLVSFASLAAALPLLLLPAAQAATENRVYYSFEGELDSVNNADGSSSFKGMSVGTSYSGLFSFNVKAEPDPNASQGNSLSYIDAFSVRVVMGGNTVTNIGSLSTFHSDGVNVDDAFGQFQDGTYASSFMTLRGEEVFNNPRIQNALNLDNYPFTTKYYYVQSIGEAGYSDVGGPIRNMRKLPGQLAQQWVDGWAGAFSGGLASALPSVASPNPEPTTWMIFGSGIAGLWRLKRRSRRKPTELAKK